MLKFIFKIIIVILLMFGLSNYANYLMTGKTPDISFEKPSLPKIDVSKLTDSVSEKFDSIKQEKSTEDTYLYKWRDAKGVIHYTSEKPSNNIANIESIKINNDTNVVPSVSSVSSNEEEPVQQQSVASELPTEIPPNLYSPEGVKQLIDQAKNVQNQMNEQFQEQENIINNE